MVPRGGKPPPPPQSRRGSNPQQTQQKKRTKKGGQKRGASLHFSPPLRAGSVVIQVQTPLVPVVPRTIPLQLPNPLNLPNSIVQMLEVKPFSMMTLTKNISAHIAWSLIRLVILIQKIHCFLFSFANIDFAKNVSRVWRGCRIVP